MRSQKNSILFQIVVTILSILVQEYNCRKHHLVLNNDIRRYFPVSTFGYFTGGSLEVIVDRFRFYPETLDENVVSNQFGFSLARTLSNNISPYIDGQYSQHSCTLNQDVDFFNNNLGVVLMKINIKNNSVSLECNPQLSKLNIFSLEHPIAKNSGENENGAVPPVNNKQQPPSLDAPPSKQIEKPVENVAAEVLPANAANDKKPSDSLPNDLEMNAEAMNGVDAAVAEKEVNNNNQQQQPPPKKLEEVKKNLDSIPVHETKREVANDQNEPIIKYVEDQQPAIDSKHSCYINSMPIKRTEIPNNGVEFSFKFRVFITDMEFEGLYALHFHNCLNYPKMTKELNQYTSIDLDMHIVEKNLNNYLSAGEIPLPQLFFALSIIFFILGMFWFASIRSRYEETFKIHYLMGVLVFVKALALLFHSIDYHFIAKEGSRVETWAVLYYITHFLKGALLFITIVLIGTGWAFIKHILNDKDKKIFMIVIPLQVIANIADIITEESEEGALIHTVWREIFILVDMICCGAILFPVIWSIRHLQEASATDGKAAINLKKLQLFRFFYVMIVFYIYFTRIIVYLVKITVPFNYEWLDAFFQHVATLVFFILTGYHFQPKTSNPYHQLLQEEIEMDEEVLFIQPSTFSEAKKRNRDLESGDMQILLQNNSYDYD